MIVVAVCVYNRIENIKHWLRCWSKCNTEGAALVIVHNHYGDQELSNQFKDICSGVAHYVPRNATGYDIGALQDVCRQRLPGFPKYDMLLWCCDDTFPMSKDFIQQFKVKHTPGTVVAMQISPYVRKHIRTTGFMIDRATAEALKFPADPVKTKEDCYRFEHRSVSGTFITQVNAVQVSDDRCSPLWDVGYHRRVERSKEHIELFGQYPLPGEVEQKEITTFVCPIYNEFPAIISSLIMQTNKNWRLWLIHNGPSDGSIESYVYSVNDDRITYQETNAYTGDWGHQTRRDWLQKVTSKYVVITNPDNYYMPTFIEKCLKQFTIKGTTVGVYSEQMVHSYTDWRVMQCRFARGFIDCGSVMLKAQESKEVGWKNVTDHSADWFFFADIAAKYGAQKFVPVKGCLFVHN